MLKNYVVVSWKKDSYFDAAFVPLGHQTMLPSWNRRTNKSSATALQKSATENFLTPLIISFVFNLYHNYNVEQW
jgi:hypothetical protein